MLLQKTKNYFCRKSNASGLGYTTKSPWAYIISSRKCTGKGLSYRIRTTGKSPSFPTNTDNSSDILNFKMATVYTSTQCHTTKKKVVYRRL